MESQKLEIRKLEQALCLGEPQLRICGMEVRSPHSSQNCDAGRIKGH